MSGPGTIVIVLLMVLTLGATLTEGRVRMVWTIGTVAAILLSVIACLALAAVYMGTGGLE